ncbi:response regulator transcription factor [Novipirellula artificiosorum]|uniref:Sensory transduction protein regX3 n=1 Tax=Novipirellula artificiosorum TaxID=2528016 RepID=A0A5C6E2Y8_9BACT|nr:response regulator transcription factor [Novipirellula artificiosorum]TWU42864.1 Sensory transduction protein regX3 [Novipirellula artificiosorum]
MTRPHILVVEDEKHLGVGIKYNLEAENYRVTLVEDGPTALRLVDSASVSIDLIVLDLMLPGMSGYSVCESIRSQGLVIPVLMLSARTLAEDRTRGFDVGANQYMSKPFELDELLSRIKNLLQISGREAGNVAIKKPRPVVDQFQFGEVKVDFETHEVIVSGATVRMTPKELKLLRYFVENPNRVISRNELLSEVWGVSGNLQTRAVDQFIARLRKIIEVEPSSPVHLLTIRDAGYRFVADSPARPN